MRAARSPASSDSRPATHFGPILPAASWIVLGIVLAAGGQRSVWAEGLFSAQPDPLKASISQASRADAIHSIPFDKLDAGSDALVRSVLSNVTIFRRMPVHVIQCDPELYLFLIDHPDVVVNIWHVLKLSQITLEQLDSAAYRLADAAGTNGTVRFLYRSSDTHLIFAEGTYDGPLTVRPVRGRSVLLLKTGYLCEVDGRCYITARLDTFTQVEPGGAELLTKTFQPLVGKIADLNFMQTAAFVGSLSKTAEVNSPGVRRLAARLTSVRPDVRHQFALLADRVAEKATGLTAVDPNRPDAVVAQHPSVTATR